MAQDPSAAEAGERLDTLRDGSWEPVQSVIVASPPRMLAVLKRPRAR